MNYFYKITLSLFIFIPLALGAQNRQKISTESFKAISDSVTIYMKTAPTASIGGRITVDTVYLYPKKRIEIHLSQNLAAYPIRDNDVETIYGIATRLLPSEYQKVDLKLFSCSTLLEDLSSAFYSGRKLKYTSDKSSYSAKKPSGTWVKNTSKPYEIEKGLQGRHIALWQSHGFYYEQKLLRWEWQRARIFQTVEDLYTQSYVLPFLVPMLENAGAFVALPRERDPQKIEVIIDNDSTTPFPSYTETSSSKEGWQTTSLPGFANPKASYETGENPFRMGSARQIEQVASSKEESTIFWSASIPTSGEYAVYISYQSLPNSSESVEYNVIHNGGETSFTVNQKMGGGTWVYLGDFSFSKNSPTQGVLLTNRTPEGSKHHSGRIVTADAVKIGGGMGNIARTLGTAPTQNKPSATAQNLLSEYLSSNNLGANHDESKNTQAPTKKVRKAQTEPEAPFIPYSEISGYPRITEGARYWLQWAGFADTVYTPNKNMNDYNDDYMSRGRWVNVLSGGSRVNPKQEGFNVPLDLAMGFHTDAGTTINDSIIGTLAIYTQFSEGRSTYPTGERRILARELTDLIQTQIVDDIRATYEPKWVRRLLWDRSYSESRSPEIPSILLELLSHQNFADMRYGLDPAFRFTVSRAIYKGMLKFLSVRYDFDYIVQPLPPRAFSVTLDKSSQNSVTLSWEPVLDPLEPTAKAEKFIVFTRISDPAAPDKGGFDNGTIIEGTTCTLPVEAGKIYSYKVAALNEGGVSFPSEILSAGFSKEGTASTPTVLVINAFDRISAPASFATRDSSRGGFLNSLDAGVPYLRDYSFIGGQHEFRRHVPWMDDDAPGFGASYANYETKIIAGNTFDYPLKHGIAILAAGYNFVSTSRDAITSGAVSMKEYPIADIILGKQVKTMVGRQGASEIKFEAFPIAFQKAISDYTSGGGNIILSGSYIASDIWDRIYEDKAPVTENTNVKSVMSEMLSLSRQLDNSLKSLDDSSLEALRLNDSLGFSYYQSDPATLSNIRAKLLKSKAYIDSTRASLNSSIADIDRFESGIDHNDRSRDFAMNVLKYRWMTHYASATGEVKAAQNPYSIGYTDSLASARYSFFNTPNEFSYCVESPDGINPVGPNTWTIFRYADNNISAGVAYRGTTYRSIALGFPIESLHTQEQINTLLADLLRFFSHCGR